MTMFVAGVQLDIVWENKQANHDKVRSLVAARKLPKGALVVLPEMFATGFSMTVDATAQSGRAETEAFLSGLAKEQGLFVCGGVVVRAPDGRGLNQSVTFSPAGASGSAILSTILWVAKSTVSKPLMLEICTKIRLVDPSAFVSNAIGRTPSLVGSIQEISSVF